MLNKYMRYFYIAALTFMLCVGASMQARADYFVWQDVHTGVSFSFPDTWKVVSNKSADDVITVMPESGRAHASCRIRTRDDARYAIYPVHYSADIQKIAYNMDFWNNYLHEFTDYKVHNVQVGAGLGRGYAGYAVAEYESAVQGPYMRRRALMFASLYNDRAYILECSSHADAFAMYKKIFLSIAASMNFQKADHEIYTGHYRNYLADPRIEFKGDEGDNVIVY